MHKEFNVMDMFKLLNQAKKMQKQMKDAQKQLSKTVLKYSSDENEVVITLNGNNEFKSLSLDSEFLKKDSSFIENKILSAINKSLLLSKNENEKTMGSISKGMGNIPGLF